MSKGNKPKNTKNTYNQNILKQMQERYGLSISYIRKSLRGDRIGIIPSKLIEEYKTLEKEVAATISKNKNVI